MENHLALPAASLAKQFSPLRSPLVSDVFLLDPFVDHDLTHFPDQIQNQ